MTMLTGVNHVAVMTADLDRFVGFYTDVFDLDVVFTETGPAFRHAILRAGPDSWIHPAELTDSAHGDALPTMFDRGHLDHVALGADSPESFETLRRRLIQRGATDGAVEDLGAFHSLWFRDPDGMHAELTLIIDPRSPASTHPDQPPTPHEAVRPTTNWRPTLPSATRAPDRRRSRRREGSSTAGRGTARLRPPARCSAALRRGRTSARTTLDRDRRSR